MVPEGYWTLPFAVSLFVRICFFSLSGQSQTSCPNSNFSTGDFTNWEGYYGDFKDPAKHKGFAPTHHTIFHAPAPFDLNTCDSLNPFPSPSLFSSGYVFFHCPGKARPAVRTRTSPQGTSPIGKGITAISRIRPNTRDLHRHITRSFMLQRHLT